MKNILLYTMVLLAWLVFLYFSFTTPTSSASLRFDLSQSALTLLRLSVALPYLLIWWLSLYSILKMRSYAQAVKANQDGKAFLKIASGLSLILASLIIPTMLGPIRTYYITTSDLEVPLTIVINYAYVLFPLAGFLLIYLGSQHLLKFIKASPLKSYKHPHFLLPIALIAISYIWLIFTNTNRQTTAAIDIPASYYLSDSLIVLTILIPAILAWSLGILTVLNIKHFVQNVTGLIYKKLMTKFSLGLVFVVTGSISIQALLSLGPTRLLEWSLGMLLMIIFAFLIIQAIGYILIARGASKLNLIETV